MEKDSSQTILNVKSLTCTNTVLLDGQRQNVIENDGSSQKKNEIHPNIYFDHVVATSNSESSRLKLQAIECNEEEEEEKEKVLGHGKFKENDSSLSTSTTNCNCACCASLIEKSESIKEFSFHFTTTANQANSGNKTRNDTSQEQDKRHTFRESPSIPSTSVVDALALIFEYPSIKRNGSGLMFINSSHNESNDKEAHRFDEFVLCDNCAVIIKQLYILFTDFTRLLEEEGRILKTINQHMKRMTEKDDDECTEKDQNITTFNADTEQHKEEFSLLENEPIISASSSSHPVKRGRGRPKKQLKSTKALNFKSKSNEQVHSKQAKQRPKRRQTGISRDKNRLEKLMGNHNIETNNDESSLSSQFEPLPVVKRLSQRSSTRKSQSYRLKSSVISDSKVCPSPPKRRNNTESKSQPSKSQDPDLNQVMSEEEYTEGISQVKCNKSKRRRKWKKESWIEKAKSDPTRTCDICHKSFIFPAVMKRHKRIVHQGMKPYSCLSCGRGFTQKVILNKHTCDFNKESGNRDYLQMTREVELRKFVCSTCGKRFKYPTHLSLHEMNHREERPFSCDQCDKTFRRPDHLKYHIRIVHVDEKKFVCSQCGTTFKSISSLRAHEKKHTTDQSHLCNICGKSIKSMYQMSRHQKTHQDELPFACPVCHKRFKMKDYLGQHLRRGKSCKPRLENSLCSSNSDSAFRVVSEAEFYSTTTTAVSTHRHLGHEGEVEVQVHNEIISDNVNPKSSALEENTKILVVIKGEENGGNDTDVGEHSFTGGSSSFSSKGQVQDIVPVFPIEFSEAGSSRTTMTNDNSANTACFASPNVIDERLLTEL